VEGEGGWLEFRSGWVPTIALVAAVSMVLGNLAAIVQGNVRRLLAYSAIAHAGYALLGVLSNDGQGIGSLVYYTITYGLATLGAFGVVAVVGPRRGEALGAFAGLSRRAPLISMCMAVFMLSLAGIPPLAGFFGKFYVFAAVVNADMGLLWLVILAIAMSAVSLYYYLQVLKQIYVADEPADAPWLRVPVVIQVVLVLIALGVIVLGCLPSLLVGPLRHAVEAAGL